MEILSVMNVTNRESIFTDSGYIFYDLLAPYLSENNSFTMVGPARLSDKNSKHIFMDLGHNKYESRFGFAWDKMSKILTASVPDVLIVNQIELIPNYKALCMALDINPVLVGYSHYVPFGFHSDGTLIVDSSLNKGGISSSIRMNYLSGIEAADQVFIHSQTGVEFIKMGCKLHSVELPDDKLHVIPPPYDSKMIDMYPVREKSKVIYNHRLYKHYGTESFIRLAEKINNTLPIKIHVFDTLGERSPERVKLDNSVELLRSRLAKVNNVEIINDGGNRSQYRKNLVGSLCSIAPNKPTAVWAMSCIDSMGMGVPVVAPNTAWFSEFISKDLQFKNDEEAIEIIEALYKDNDFWLDKSKEAQKKVLALPPSKIASMLLSSFKDRLAKKNGEALKV